MSNLEHVRKLAGVLRGITIAAMVVLPLAILGGLIAIPLTPDVLSVDITPSPDATRMQLMLAAGLSLLRPLILLWTLNEMRKLFGAYNTGDVLTDHAARLIQRIGQGFVAMAVVPFLVQPVQSVLLTLANPPGQRSLAIGLDSEMIFFILSGGLIIVIGWAMREASAAAAENRAIV